MYALLVMSGLAGFAGAVGVTTQPAMRWIDREFRFARGLRRLLLVLGITLATASLGALIARRWPWFELFATLTAITGMLLAVVLLVAPHLRRTGAVTLRARRILAIGAHPDDIELACGATLAKLIDEGHEVHTIVMSHGAAGGHDAVREAEARRGSRYLGTVETTVHDFEDRALRSCDNAMIAVIEAEIATFHPDVLLTHSANDQHQDHEAVHHATMRAGRRCPTILCFESPSVTRQFSPSFFVDVSAYIGAKVHAIELHRDQRGKPYMTAARARMLAAFRGEQARVPQAEGFEVIRVGASSIGEV